VLPDQRNLNAGSLELLRALRKNDAVNLLLIKIFTQGAKCMLRIIASAVTVGLALFAALPAHAERRLALVMGNGAYKTAPLANAVNDARLIADRLQAERFEIFPYYNASQKDMKRAVVEFTSAVRGSGMDTVVFIYYAGHGVQVNGENYLIPADASIDKEGDVDIESVGVSSLMSALERLETRLKIVVLDACRTNPFGYARSGDRGLARIDAPSGSIVAFSTAPGKSAQDGEGGHSLYTTALAEALGEPGLKIEDVFKKARVAVSAATNGEQTPWESTSLMGDFYPAGEKAGSGEQVAALKNVATKPRPEPDQRRTAALTAPLTAPLANPPVETASFRDCGDCPEMVPVPTGTFMMGSAENESERLGDEGPQHRVTIARPFAIGKYAVTFAEWDACVADGGCGGYKPSDNGWGRGDHPVIYVFWRDAQNYVRWLRAKTGMAYRLPSEAEREYAARAGTSTPFWWGTAISTSQANYNGDYTYGNGKKGQNRAATLPVSSFEPNPWGLYQMHGNVWEWADDCFHGGYYAPPTDGSAWKGGLCFLHVIRGGSWQDAPAWLRSARRLGWVTRWRHVGFRVARSMEPQ
jgi:formylglycine-generating enzyme required for sulfatase activity